MDIAVTVDSARTFALTPTLPNGQDLVVNGVWTGVGAASVGGGLVAGRAAWRRFAAAGADASGNRS